MKGIKANRLHRFFRSVFTKLILINLIAWFLILFAIISLFLWSGHQEGPFYRNARLYIQYIIEDLGSPPNKKNALELHQKAGIHITFQNQETEWTTHKSWPDVEKVNFRVLHGNDAVLIGKLHGRHLLQIQTEVGKLYFEFAGFKEEIRHKYFSHLLVFLALTGILLACYFALKYMLRPLKWLESGVAEVAAGNLSHQVPARGNDELTQLAHSFNDMTTKLKQTMQTKEHLLRDISHELRSPLTRMKVALALINDDQLKHEIEQDVIEMESMVTLILDSARAHQLVKEYKPIRSDLGQLISSVVNKYSKIEPGVSYQAPLTSIYCKIDAKALSTVLTNLIDNGLKFSVDSGRPVEIKLTKDKNTATIIITDHGSGIEATELPFIFEPFYRIDRSRSRKTGGFGLGLSLCKAIIEAHDGKIEVKSQVGKGSQFTLALPLKSPKT